MMDLLEIMELTSCNQHLHDSKTSESRDGSDTHILDLSTVYYFKSLIKKYQKEMGDTEASSVSSGGLQQYLIKESEKNEKLQREQLSNQQQSQFEQLPVNVKLQIFSHLSATDLCQLSRVCRSWRDITGDNLLWQGLMERDIHGWNIIGHNTNPDIYKEVDSDWSSKEIYLRCSPEINRMMHSQNFVFSNISSMLRYFLPKKTPMFAMFGPGLETGTSILVRTLMTGSPDIKNVGMYPGRFGGVGGGFTLKISSTQFHLSVLYSAPKYERERGNRDRTQQNKLLVEDKNADSDSPERFGLVPAVQDFCRTLDGFVYVCDAKDDVAAIESGLTELLAMVSERWSATHVPVLVLSAVRESKDTRLSCHQVVRKLQLSKLSRPWQVRNCVASTLEGAIEGFQWLSEQSQRR